LTAFGPVEEIFLKISRISCLTAKARGMGQIENASPLPQAGAPALPSLK
jgi:hypothetical protein